MMKYLSNFIFYAAMVIGLLVFACKPATENSDNTGNNTATETPTVPVTPPMSAAATSQSNTGHLTPSTDPQYAGLGSIQIEAMRDLYEHCTSLDIIFYETNFSLSQTDQAAIQTTLFYLLPSPVVHNANCKPIGRITFLIQGEIRREADIYCSEGCNYFIWIEDNKPAYINPLTPEGIAFFTQIIQKGVDQFK